MLFISSSVGVKLGDTLVSRGLLSSDAGVRTAGTGRVGSRPVGYDRGSGRLTDDIDERDDAMDGAIPLLPVDVENVDATERREDSRERSEEFDDEYDEAIELRPEPCELKVHFAN